MCYINTRSDNLKRHIIRAHPEVPPTKVPPEVPPTKVPPTKVPPEVPPEVPPTKVPPTKVPPTKVPPEVPPMVFMILEGHEFVIPSADDYNAYWNSL